MFKKNFYNYFLLVVFFMSNVAFSQEVTYPELKNTPDLLQEDLVEKKKTDNIPDQNVDYSDKIIKNFNMLLKKVNIKGNSAISSQDLHKFYAKYLDKNIGYNELVSILESMGNEYKKRGYFLSYVLPDQNFIQDGVVNIKIIEGAIKVHVLDEHKDNKLLNTYVSNIEACNPIKKDIYERNIELMKKLSGLDYISKAQLNEKAIKEGSSKILDVYILSDKNDVEGLLFIDNTSKNKDQGPLTIWNINNFHNLLDLNETIKVAFETSGSFSKRRDVQVGLNIPLNANGLSFSATVGKKYISNSHQVVVLPMKEGAQPVIFNNGVETDKKYVDFKLSNSPILSFNKKLTTSIGYALDKLTNKGIIAEEEENISKYNIPKLYLEANYFFQDKFKGDNYLNAKLSTSSKSLGAKNYIGNTFKSFKVMNVDFSRRDSFKNNIVSILQAESQFSNNHLPGSEKFSYGGWNYGRAYHTPVIVGDRGANVSLKLLKLLYKQNNKQIYLLTPYIYADSGFTRNKNDAKKYSASSFGAGIEMFMRNGIKLNYSCNKPLKFKNVPDVRRSKINHVITFITEYKF
jgi:hemolysin activation/secretion protein